MILHEADISEMLVCYDEEVVRHGKVHGKVEAVQPT